MTEPTVYVVDDDSGMRKAIAYMATEEGYTVATYASADEFLEGELPKSPGCIVLDVRMPGASGLELQEMLVEKGIGLPILFVTGHGDVPMCAKAMKSGAIDFLEKPFNRRDLLHGIEQALRVDAKHAADQEIRTEFLERFEALTPREREVMELLVNGIHTKGIASALDISVKTVDSHRVRVLEKMGAESLVELTRFALEAGYGGK